MRIVFMGTPEIATFSLKKISESEHEIVGVVTATDKPAGRGRKIKFSDVKKFALEKNLNILQPEKLKNPDFIEKLSDLKPDLIVVLAFRMLPKEVWQLPKYGTINLHASLLPQYRGAAPINWAIINGETETGVSTFFIDEKIDTGKIILQEKVVINDKDNAGTLHDKIMIKGADTLLKTISLIEENKHFAVEQDKIVPEKMQLKPAPKIYKSDCRINWQDSLKNIYNLIRGMNPYPGAWCYLIKNDKEIFAKIFDVDVENQQHSYNIGHVVSDKNGFKIAVSEGFIIVKKIRIEGKKTLNSDEFIRGFDLKNCIFN